MSSETILGQEWRPDRYRDNAAFVPELGQPLLALLAPRPGERVLDLGCGEGALTERLRGAGCDVVGVDAAPAMVAAARARGLDARVIDGHSLPFVGEFDAVFTNAALHWMRADPGAVVAGVARALRPGGRFVGEFGGHGNVAAIRVALYAVLARHGLDGTALDPWYFPTANAYRGLLEAQGFAVEEMALHPRPTPLPGDIAGWLETFAGPFLHALPAGDRTRAVKAVSDLLRPVLADADGCWTADYVRLRFAARLKH